MAYRCEAKSVDGFLAQVGRLVGSGHYFYFAATLRADKDPQNLDRKLIDRWDLDKPAWKREARRRGAAPNIHYLRYKRFYVLLATHGKGEGGIPHPFFVEYQRTLGDIRKNALRFCGYSIRYPVSRQTGSRRLFVRLDKRTYGRIRSQLMIAAIGQRYRDPDAFESVVRDLPFQWYRPVRDQLRVILKDVNRVRRRAGFEPVRLACIPMRMRVTDVFVEAGHGSTLGPTADNGDCDIMDAAKTAA